MDIGIEKVLTSAFREMYKDHEEEITSSHIALLGLYINYILNMYDNETNKNKYVN